MSRVHLLFVVTLTTLIVTSHGKPAADDKDENVKELLKALKNYLGEKEAKPEAKVATKQTKSAYDDNRVAFAPTATSNDVSTAESNNAGYWTEWLNVDWNPNIGPGEYEDTSRVKVEQNLQRRCLLGCSSPIASMVSVNDVTVTAPWSEIEKCTGPIDASRFNYQGFVCLNREVRDYNKVAAGCDLSKCVEYGLGVNCTRCPNVRAKFFCTGTQPPKDQCCPYSNDCTITGRSGSGLRSAITLIADADARRDVIAGYLDDVETVLSEMEMEEEKRSGH